MQKNSDEKGLPKLNINWYPGHMAKTKRQIIEDLKIIDIVIEIVDARIPRSSRNPAIKPYIENKTKMILLNKSDLADEEVNKEWVNFYKKQGIVAVLVDCNSGKGVQEVLKQIERLGQEQKEKMAAKGRVGKSTRMMIIGVPNVGKSSFINRVSKKTSAEVGNKPGVTRQKQWIRIGKEMELLDTPGVLWPKFESEELALHLAFTGTIKDDILPKVEIAYALTKYLLEQEREKLLSRYEIKEETVEAIFAKEDLMENEKIVEVMHLIGKKRGCLIAGGQIDEEKVTNCILDDFRKGKIGRISLERP